MRGPRASRLAMVGCRDTVRSSCPAFALVFAVESNCIVAHDSSIDSNAVIRGKQQQQMP